MHADAAKRVGHGRQSADDVLVAWALSLRIDQTISADGCTGKPFAITLSLSHRRQSPDMVSESFPAAMPMQANPHAATTSMANAW
jgi:hypothetical protein